MEDDETILVVDDIRWVRDLLERLLSLSGYTVLTAEGGIQALRMARIFEGPIHLLITDMVMPGMDGRQLIDEMAKLRPDTKVLILSSYFDDQSIQVEIEEGRIPFIQKPFDNQELVEKIQALLKT